MKGERDGRGGEGERRGREGEGSEGGLCSSNISLKNPDSGYQIIAVNPSNVSHVRTSGKERGKRKALRHYLKPQSCLLLLRNNCCQNIAVYCSLVGYYGESFVGAVVDVDRDGTGI